jgi:hypothetical protein
MPEGVFVGPNLTPDKETGLGNWTTEAIIQPSVLPTRRYRRRRLLC